MKPHVPYRYFRTAMIARLSSLRVAAEPGPRYRASGAAAARPGGRLAQPPLPPEAAYVGLGLRCGGSTLCTDIALRRRALHRSEEHTSELQSLTNLVCRLLLEK